jgi:phosphate-selective porin OprO and OprP
MKSITGIFAAVLLAGSSGAALAAGTDTRIETLESQIQELSKQVQELKTDARKQVEADKAKAAGIAAQQAEMMKQQVSAPKTSVTGGRLTVASADGAFTASVRALLQADTGLYMQGGGAAGLPAAYGPDLSSGSNFRRLFLGLQGKVFGDWSYYFLYDFGGAATETPAHIMYAYLQYDGLAPWALRLGAYAPPANLEDATAAADLLFLERNSPSNLQRNIAGSEGRMAVSLLYMGERLYGALSLTGNRVQDGAKAWAPGTVANYDEQMSVLGRLSYLPVSTDEAHWLVGINGLDVLKLPDLVRNGGATLATVPGASPKSVFCLSDLPETAIDSNGIALANTGSLPADHVTQWGVETAGNFQNFYGQAGYYAYNIHRTPVAYNVYSAAGVFAPAAVQPGSNTFTGWYVQGSWVLTGESRSYNPASAAFGAPKPAQPFSLKDGGWGALEVVARYSDLNLNSHTGDTANAVTDWTSSARSTTYYNTVRGGEQKIVTLGLNWYLNTAIRFALDYQWIDVTRLQAPSVVTTAGTPVLPALNGGQSLNTLALRAQLAI